MWRRCWRADIDAVYIATPTQPSLSDGMQALKAGKHVLIEKPSRSTLAKDVNRPKPPTEGKTGAGRCGAITRRYDVIRQLLEDGVLGNLHTLQADHGEYFTAVPHLYCRPLPAGR